jgi:HNH endonuclease
MWALYHVSMNPKKFRSYCAAGCGRRANTSVAKYCSVRCQHLDEHRARVRRLEQGGYPASLWSTQFLRRYLVEMYGEKCSRCGWAGRNVKTGRVMVEVEHIDGDWRNTRPENLTLLCPNCHSLTPTFKALNRGRGRPGRHDRGQKPLPPVSLEPGVSAVKACETKQLQMFAEIDARRWLGTR